ncbi:PAS domain S-box protein [Halobellus ruber]|uniref:histidine kinase n=1 Tax=Halobellus ruber TaxID=2761102 RepID=A0A7J9SD93_9EURY|nr:PAS domain S-box protein [Halobellus ruber]MBB6644894.1 PAS domain S-box protein [Halobellus ruber]
MGGTVGRTSGTIRVLHVDDDPDFVDLAATFLEEEYDQFTVETATSPSDGLDRLADTEFDCIISDYDMPGQNGIEFLAAVRTEHPDLPFILYTGKGSEEIASNAISAGVTDYLQKKSGTDQYVVLGNRVKNAVEQFRSQQALTKRNRELQRYKRMVNSIHEAACIYDSEGRFELVNEYLAEWYNSTPAELAGEQSTLIPRIREQADGDPFQELLSGKRNEIQGELDNTFPDHGYAVLEYRLTPLRADGTIEGVVGVARDITDRRAQQAEFERKDRAMDAAPVGITISDPSQDDNPLIYVNDRFTEMTGYPEEEVLGSNCRFLQGEHTNPEAVAQMREAIASEEPVTVELRNYRQDGTEFWNRVSIAPVYGDDGELTNYVGFQQDVTEEKEHEQKLHEEQAFIEQSLDTLDDIFYFVDTDGDFQRWNSKLPELTGYSDAEIGSMNALEFFEGEHREAIEHSINEIFETGSHVTEAEITTADGRQVPHEFRGVRMTDDDGEPTGIIGIARDITEQRKRERQLEEKTEELEQLATKFETQYRTLFEKAPVMTILTRAEDGEPIIEDCNSQFVETLGYDADAILNRELADFYTSDSAETLLEEGGYKRSVEGTFDREKRELVTADGEVVETLLRAVPRRTADGEVIGTMAMYIDISERESVKRANERLEEFTSVVSHDLRNPLNVATGRLELVADECDSDHLDDVERALNRMGTLIDDLLTLAREGQEVTDAQPVDLSTMINGCWENVETKQAVLTTRIDRSVLADRSRLKQVFENLFRNAVEHGGADVTITIGELDDGFYIEDDGPGIPVDEREAIFEAGYSRSADGTGFGLSIVEQVVTAHDWQIRVTNGSDGGARFEITDVEFVAP